MKCRYCGTDIAPNSMYCGRCGKEVQIVPDYSPLEDVLVAQVKGSLGYTSTMPLGDIAAQFSKELEIPDKAVRVQGRNTDTNHQKKHSSEEGNTERLRVRDERDVRRREARKKERMRRKRQKRRVVLIIMFLVLAAVVGGIFVLYTNSYSGLVASGRKAIEKKEYDKAIVKFEKASKKNGSKIDAYNGLAETYLAQGETETAEQTYLNVLEKQTDNADAYVALCEFYLKVKQVEKISPLIDSCDSDAVLEQVKKYTVKKPAFSLKEETFDDVQELKLTSKGNTIYYTTDDSQPTIESTKYAEPIQIVEGANKIKAISVNELGIPSLMAERVYTVEFPLAYAPSVTPSTGRYSQAMKIKITVPEGYTAYYTFDGSTPDENSNKYSEPIDMPEGSNIFTAVLINGKGKATEVTKRNYELNLE